MVPDSDTVSGASCPCSWSGTSGFNPLTASIERSLVLLVTHGAEVFAGSSITLSSSFPEKADSR